MNLDDKFMEALFGDDELGVVVRAHIHIEARINSLLEVLVPVPRKLPRLRFEQKVNLAVALGLKEDGVEAIKELGNIRNRFGHKLDTRLTPDMVKVIAQGLADHDREVLMEGYEMTRQQVPSPPFESLNAKDQFIILCTGIDKLLGQSIAEVRARVGRPAEGA